YLTDLTTIFFGFGIFGANTAFQFYQGNDRWGYSKLGYLTQEEWAYGLALWAYLRNEPKPEWIKFLNVTVKKEFEKCLIYIIENKEALDENEE
ncbi:MAG: hypothetical protein K2Q22_10700, partial [Cytophagales bacterium]|nr:hypothetical protein [Cytophagales bacterium]